MHINADGLTRIVFDRASVSIPGIGRRQTHRFESFLVTQICDRLCSGKGGDHQVESWVEIAGLDRRTVQQLRYLCPGGVQILVEVEGAEGPWRIPTSSGLGRILRIQSVSPGRIGDAEPLMAVGQPCCDQPHG